MEFLNHFKIIESLIVFVIAFFIRLFITKSLRKIQTKFGFQNSRILVTNKIITILIYITIVVVISFIWGVDEEQLLIYISSFLTILGIAFFAQWSILSNITAGIILYVNYPVKIGDTITILDKENPVTGEIRDIGAFFITLKTPEKELVTLPNAIILQKNIKYSPQPTRL
ncbi:mechanosensitive ion channel domain-containing protein [Polaribacter sp. IC073]|uniref:mechanosensitive ion channel domain-containing protein n=1 Tax=Polaribacter sp. IC073 TaxID=2508540 RepID=UPI0011BD5AF2|nr:mechanosensitive ion channel domain-containing protein [Polaribacter sp. IC073]TXD49677.1 mechanosensitive ion channel [Polaribacter sp. IC073]